MRFFQKSLDFFVYSNLFIAICAVLMVNQTYHFLLNRPLDWNFTGFVFFSTLCSYSFHWYLTSHSLIPSTRINWTHQYRFIHIILFFIGIAGSGYFFFFLVPHWHWLLISAIVTFLYSAPKIPHKYFKALRKVALGKTIFLAFVWMYVTTVLPIIMSDKEWHTVYILYAVSRFFLIYAICILFDYRDRADDKAAGIRSLITTLNEKSISLVFTASLLIYVVTTLWMFYYNYSALAITLLLVPGAIVVLVYNKAKKSFNDMFYYFSLDGLMALSAFLMLIAGI